MGRTPSSATSSAAAITRSTRCRRRAEAARLARWLLDFAALPLPRPEGAAAEEDRTAATEDPRLLGMGCSDDLRLLGDWLTPCDTRARYWGSCHLAEILEVTWARYSGSSQRDLRAAESFWRCSAESGRRLRGWGHASCALAGKKQARQFRTGGVPGGLKQEGSSYQRHAPGVGPRKFQE